MTHGPDGPPGLGAPGDGRPDFLPPQSGPVPSPNTAPGRTAKLPAGRPPRRPRSGRRAVVAVVLAGGLLLIGLLSALPVLPATVPAPTLLSSAGAPEVVTVSPSPAPSAANTTASGGDLGRPVPFAAASGSGTLTVSRAVWTDAGEVAPDAGQRYLVLDVTVACTKGEVAVDPILLLATVGQEGQLPGFGPSLQRPLGGRLLTSGQRVSGQVGYVLAPGAVEVSLLDESLQGLAHVGIPAP